MKYYAVVELNITDDFWMEDYTPSLNALVKKHGGVYLARTMTMERVEGDRALPGAFAIIEWPSKEAAQAFYSDPEYQPYLKSRLAGSNCDFTLVAGEDIAA